MLRTDTQVALHDLLEALRAAVDLYADDAELLAEGELARLCRELGQRHERQAAVMADQVRRHGDLPSEPDADRETLHRLGNRLRTLLAQDDGTAVLRARLNAEAELARLAARAADMVAEPDTRELLAGIRRDSEQACSALERFSAR